MKNHFNDGVAKEPDSSERLDGRKQIAVFLKRDVRTVRRREKQEDLPIHRHVHEKRASRREMLSGKLDLSSEAQRAEAGANLRVGRKDF